MSTPTLLRLGRARRLIEIQETEAIRLLDLGFFTRHPRKRNILIPNKRYKIYYDQGEVRVYSKTEPSSGYIPTRGFVSGGSKVPACDIKYERFENFGALTDNTDEIMVRHAQATKRNRESLKEWGRGNRDVSKVDR